MNQHKLLFILLNENCKCFEEHKQNLHRVKGEAGVSEADLSEHMKPKPAVWLTLTGAKKRAVSAVWMNL